MTNDNLWQKYKEMLATTNFVITYKALSDEIEFSQTPCFEIIKNKPTFSVPQTHEVAPNNVAKQILDEFKHQKSDMDNVLIFLPGKQFDLYGTRNGRGFGWYDKLLSSLPIKWVRIGIAKNEQLSLRRIERQKWDQPIDWLIWEKPKGGWQIMETPKR